MIKKLDGEDKLNSDHTQFLKVLDEAQSLRMRKNAMYGDSYKAFGSIGVAVKLVDKVERIKNMIKNPKLRDFESIRDSALDLLNYSAMYIMLIDEENKDGTD